MCDKISVKLLMIWTCPVGQLFCKLWLPEPKIDCPGQLGNLIVAPCFQTLFLSFLDEKMLEGRG